MLCSKSAVRTAVLRGAFAPDIGLADTLNSTDPMEPPDLLKLRRFALAIAVVLVTLVLAGVKLESPARVAPLGIPMTA